MCTPELDYVGKLCGFKFNNSKDNKLYGIILNSYKDDKHRIIHKVFTENYITYLNYGDYYIELYHWLI